MRPKPDDCMTPAECTFSWAGLPDRDARHRAKCTMNWALQAMTFVSGFSAFDVRREENSKCRSHSKLALHV